jgi:hypothetical protein
MTMNVSDNPSNETAAPVMVDIRHLTAEQLAQLGVAQVAYVKPVTVNGVQGFAIHAADGTAMAVAGNLEFAVAAIRQHEMHPVSVH